MKRVMSIPSQTKHVKVTPSTEMSSLLFDDASTFHSFSGIGICKEGKEEILKRIEQRHDKLSAWAALLMCCLSTREHRLVVFKTVKNIARNIRKVFYHLEASQGG